LYQLFSPDAEGEKNTTPSARACRIPPPPPPACFGMMRCRSALEKCSSFWRSLSSSILLHTFYASCMDERLFPFLSLLFCRPPVTFFFSAEVQRKRGSFSCPVEPPVAYLTLKFFVAGPVGLPPFPGNRLDVFPLVFR